MGLLSGDLDQFDAPVPGPSVVGLVGGHGRPGSGAEGHQARGGDAVPGDQIGDDGLGARLGKLQVGGGVANHVGVPDDSNLQRGVVGEQLGDLVDGRPGLRLDVALGGVEEDAGHLDVARVAEAALERVGVGHHVLLHLLHLDNEHGVHPALRLGD